MAGDSSKIQIGVGWISFGGVNLGYTKGGISITIERMVHDVIIPQAGSIPVVEVNMGLSVKVSTTLAETNATKMTTILGTASLGQDIRSSSTTSGSLVITEPNLSHSITIANAYVRSMSPTMTPDREMLWRVDFVGTGYSTTPITL